MVIVRAVKLITGGPMNKQCRKCGDDKDIELFGKCSRYKDGRMARCKSCMREEQRRGHANYAKNHPDRQYSKTHPEEFRVYVNEALKPRYGRYKQGAKKRELEFCITLRDFDELTSKPCCYCNLFSPDKDFCGIDRVDSGKGYVLDNCVPCCSICNVMKMELSLEMFLSYIERIYQHYITKHMATYGSIW